MSLEAGTRIGRYEIQRLLGAGGMGEVYLARDPKIGREVAIKVLPESLLSNPERLRRFEQEAQAAGALNHPNILAIYDVETHDGAPYVVSELLEGQTLRELLGGAALPVRKATDYGLQLARGLAAAHEKGIVHRDLKPENIFITSDGRAKILDFGLAKLTETDGDSLRSDLPTRKVQTDPGAVMGTVGYMSPEQLRGRPVDARTDIFSFGAVLYEMLSGHRAFHKDSVADTISAILREDPPELSETNRSIHPGLDRVVRRCLEKNREERFHSASDLAFALEALSSDSIATASHATQSADATFEPAARRAKVWRVWLPWALVVLFATLAATLAYLNFRRAEPRAEVVRFALPAPEKAMYDAALALSPDGRRLAFITSSAGVRSLWVRSLDTLEARQLAGTEDADFPFWSPDSRHIAFFANAKLKKIDAAGGPAQTLADASADPRGGAWGADGTILFTPNFSSPLFKVSASGGAVTQVTTLDEARAETSHRWPVFLPDGRRFIFFSRSTQKESEGVYTASLDSKETRLLINARLRADYAPSAQNSSTGYLLFMREDALVAQELDTKKMELSGEPAVVVEGVLNYPNEGGPTAYAAFSVSANGHLSYLSGNRLLTQLGWFDRAGNALGQLGPVGQLHEPALSPDDKRITYAREEQNTSDIWVTDVARGTATRLTFEDTTEACSAWSPDASRIVFSSRRNNRFELFTKISSGAGGEELLHSAEGNLFADHWIRMPDGRQFIIYEHEDPKTRFDLFILPLDGERKAFPFLMTQFNETHAQFSPDGRWIAYASDESGRSEIYVQSFPVSGGKWQVSIEGGDQPQWRADGRELYYLAPDKKLMAVPITAGATFESGVPVALFTARVLATNLTDDRNHYVATRDGQRFLVNNLVNEGNTQPITTVLNWMTGLKR